MPARIRADDEPLAATVAGARGSVYRALAQAVIATAIEDALRGDAGAIAFLTDGSHGSTLDIWAAHAGIEAGPFAERARRRFAPKVAA